MQSYANTRAFKEKSQDKVKDIVSQVSRIYDSIEDYKQLQKRQFEAMAAAERERIEQNGGNVLQSTAEGMMHG